LDVGVLSYCFVLFLLGEAGFFLSSFIGSFIGSFIRLVDFTVFVSGALVELVSLSRWFAGFVSHFLSGFSLGSGLIFGGGGC